MNNRHYGSNSKSNSKNFHNKNHSKSKPNYHSKSKTHFNHNSQIYQQNRLTLNRSSSDPKEDTENSPFMVISDSSEFHKQAEADSQPQAQVDQNQNILAEQNCQESHLANQKPIHARTFEERLGLKTQTQQKTSKKIKLNEEAQQEAVIIRFDAKNSVQTESVTSEDMKKLEKVKLKKAYPWISNSTKEMEDAMLRFHNEIVEFYEYARPSKKEHEIRLAIFQLVKTMILDKYPTAKIEYFGSFATKLYLPDGDIDITVLLDDIEEYQERGVYDAINKIVRKHEGTIFCDIQYIKSSKVPLIKLVHIDTQIPFDISVNKKDGLNQVEHVNRMKRLYPEFEPMVFVLKTALKIRNMSETYTGGVGSFLLFCMILHFLRHVHKKDQYYTMGEYIMKFMEFYAINGDWERKSVYVADGTQVGRPREPNTLSFMSPQDDSHDIGKSAFKIRDVFNVFKNRFRVIAGKNFKAGESLLKELINPSGQEFRYYKYDKAMQKNGGQ